MIIINPFKVLIACVLRINLSHNLADNLIKIYDDVVPNTVIYMETKKETFAKIKIPK